MLGFLHEWKERNEIHCKWVCSKVYVKVCHYKKNRKLSEMGCQSLTTRAGLANCLALSDTSTGQRPPCVTEKPHKIAQKNRSLLLILFSFQTLPDLWISFKSSELAKYTRKIKMGKKVNLKIRVKKEANKLDPFVLLNKNSEKIGKWRQKREESSTILTPGCWWLLWSLALVAHDKVLSLLKGDKSARKRSAHRDRKQCCSVGRAC